MKSVVWCKIHNSGVSENRDSTVVLGRAAASIHPSGAACTCSVTARVSSVNSGFLPHLKGGQVVEAKETLGIVTEYYSIFLAITKIRPQVSPRII